jgi:Predicted carbamoyl transferase, NodU family
MTNNEFHNLFGQPPRKPDKDKLTQFHMDIASSIQKVTEDIMLKLVKGIKDEFNIDNLCLAGGVALNCVANGKILKEKIFENIWVQPAAGDAGGSLGAALAMWYIEEKNIRIINKNDDMQGSYLGPEFSQNEIEKSLNNIGAKFSVLNDEDLIKKTAKKLSEEKVIGWFQGRMEFGPRSLGCRSILGDPRSENTQKNLNLKIKFRESFRPFAPSVLIENVHEWFDLKSESPYMLLVADIDKQKKIEMTDQQNSLFLN